MHISTKTQTQIFRSILVLAIAGVFILTLMKTANLPTISLNDKVVHLLTFIVLGFLADYSFEPTTSKISKTLLLLGFGVVIEIAQYFTSWRTAEWQDVVADLLGIFIYWIFAPFMGKLFFKSTA